MKLYDIQTIDYLIRILKLEHCQVVFNCQGEYTKHDSDLLDMPVNTVDSMVKSGMLFYHIK